MKITTRIILGYALFIAVLVGLVVYQVITVRRMQDLNRKLGETGFQNGIACLEAWRDVNALEEYARKLFFRGDPDYLKPLQELRTDFEKNLNQVEKHADSADESVQVQRLKILWSTFTADLEQQQKELSQKGIDLPENLQNDLEQLRVQTNSVYQASKHSISTKADKSSKTAETAEIVLYCSTFVALATSILVSFLIFRSISKPLAHLTEGTRAIAEGKFFYRLDTTRNDEFSQLAKDFNTMTRRLNELDELKKDFVSHVSHEMKAPLASMRETIQLLLEQIPGPLTDKQKRLLELNLQSGSRLTAMISNLLDLSKTEAGVMEYELKSQDLLPMVRNAIAELEMQARERQIQIQAALPEEPLLVECDSDRIVQVIVNLVGNAVKFSPRAATVHVRVEATSEVPKSMPDHWRRLTTGSDQGRPFGLVTVEDSGPGIPDSDKEKVFEKFHQVKQGKKIAGQGVGLGLAICRTIVQAHRGAIWMEDNPGGGSRFQLLLRSGEKREGVVPRASHPI